MNNEDNKAPRELSDEDGVSEKVREDFEITDPTTAQIAALLDRAGVAPDPATTGVALIVIAAETWMHAVPDASPRTFRVLCDQAFRYARDKAADRASAHAVNKC